MVLDLPRLHAFQWLTSTRQALPRDLARRLLDNLLEPAAVILGSVSACMITAGGYLRTGSLPLLVLAILDLVVLGHRLWLLRQAALARRAGRAMSSDGVVANELVFATLGGLETASFFATGDHALQVIGPFTMMGFLTAIVARNSILPRYTLTQMLLLGGPFQLCLVTAADGFWLLLLAQFPIFLVIMWQQVHRLSEAFTSVLLAERDSQQRARTDPLTGLVNRHGLIEILDGLRRVPGDVSRFALLFIDLDGFKGVNDAHGHRVGDAVLRIAAQRLTECLPADTVAVRIGGDEFVVLLPEPADGAADRLGACLIKTFGRPIPLESGETVVMGASIGITAATADEALHEVLARADAALYRAKAGGKGRAERAEADLVA